MRRIILTLAGCLLCGAALAAEAWETMLDLVAPVTVVSCDMCLDGGSIKGSLVDANGKYYAFFIDRAMRVIPAGGACVSALSDTGRSELPGHPPFGRWYVGADYNTGNAEMLEPGDRRIVAIRMVMQDWIDRVASPDEQAHLRSIKMQDMPRDSCGVTSVSYHTKWFIANNRGALK